MRTSYADTVKIVKMSYGNSIIPDSSNVVFCSIMTEARDADIAEEYEQNRQVCNIILHVVKEDGNTAAERAKRKEEAYAYPFSNC